jgi:hypothetical protein
MTKAWLASRAETIQRAIGEARDELMLTAPDAETLTSLGQVEDVEWPRHVRVLTTKDQLAQLRRDFLSATKIADFIGQDRLEVRTAPDSKTLLQPLLITSDDLTCLLIPGGDKVGAMTTDNEELFHFVRGEYLSMWGTAAVAELRAPQYSVILETIGERFDDPMQTDAETMLQSSLEARGFGDGLDEIHAFILLAAKHGKQYYELSHWGEELQLGSPARFSNRKKELEEAGVIETENVETGSVGRPRQRLRLSDSKLQDADLQQIIAAAQSVL